MLGNQSNNMTPEMQSYVANEVNNRMSNALNDLQTKYSLGLGGNDYSTNGPTGEAYKKEQIEKKRIKNEKLKQQQQNNEDNNNNNNNNGNGNGNGNNNKQGKKKKVKKQYVKLTEQNIHNAFQILKEGKRAKFDETVDVAIQLNVDPRKQTQAVKGIASLPQGLGKKIRVAVFANGNDIDVAKRAGADFAGSDDLIQMVQNGNIPFDRVIATPDIMSKLSRIGKVLGPRGLMPNPKLGTVTTDVERAVKNAKAGSVTYRVDKQGIIHCGIGKVSFEVNALIDNCRSLMISLFAAKPEAFKGKYVKLMHISSTMGRSIPVDLSTIDPNNPKFMLDEEAIKKLGF